MQKNCHQLLVLDERGRSGGPARGTQPTSPTTAMGRTAWGESGSIESYGGAGGAVGSVQTGEWSRRSSLKSTIIPEIEGLQSRADSPGPQHTVNPFDPEDSPRERDQGGGYYTGKQILTQHFNFNLYKLF
jgi:hypothetical protein